MLRYLPCVSTAFLVLGMVLPIPPVWSLQGGKDMVVEVTAYEGLHL